MTWFVHLISPRLLIYPLRTPSIVYGFFKRAHANWCFRGFDSGEGAWETATTSKEGSRRANYPIPIRGGSKLNLFFHCICFAQYSQQKCPSHLPFEPGSATTFWEMGPSHLPFSSWDQHLLRLYSMVLRTCRFQLKAPSKPSGLHHYFIRVSSPSSFNIFILRQTSVYQRPVSSSAKCLVLSKWPSAATIRISEISFAPSLSAQSPHHQKNSESILRRNSQTTSRFLLRLLCYAQVSVFARVCLILRRCLDVCCFHLHLWHPVSLLLASAWKRPPLLSRPLWHLYPRPLRKRQLGCRHCGARPLGPVALEALHQNQARKLSETSRLLSSQKQTFSQIPSPWLWALGLAVSQLWTLNVPMTALLKNSLLLSDTKLGPDITSPLITLLGSLSTALSPTFADANTLISAIPPAVLPLRTEFGRIIRITRRGTLAGTAKVTTYSTMAPTIVIFSGSALTNRPVFLVRKSLTGNTPRSTIVFR